MGGIRIITVPIPPHIEVILYWISTVHMISKIRALDFKDMGARFLRYGGVKLKSCNFISN